MKDFTTDSEGPRYIHSCLDCKPKPTRLKARMWVKVYADPMTKQRLEGIAKLMARTRVAPHDGLEHWYVHFGDEEIYQRWVSIADLCTGNSRIYRRSHAINLQGVL